EIGGRYSSLLKSVLTSDSSVLTPFISEGNTSVYAQYTLRVKNRDDLATQLKNHGIPCAVYYPKCLHEQPAFAFCNYHWGDFPESEKASREVLSLPMHPYLSEADLVTIVRAVQLASVESCA
ncbi:MAG: DegT/DnrJ/EryC1/StrS family aminotransferase, partial [Chlorobium sp.]|nr:DegT/DnrJ/EryC1/StrS family aminotransferase [Chlorobium sp.]